MAGDEKTIIRLKKARWHSRRGMLELDKLLKPYVDKRLPLLSDNNLLELELFESLLELEDPQLLHLMNHPEENQKYTELIKSIHSLLSDTKSN